MKRKRGFAAIFTLSITTLIVLIVTAFAAIAYNDISIARRAADTVRAYYLAEAGAAKKFMELRSGNTLSITDESFAYISGFSGSFSVSVTLVTGTPVTYRIDSTGTYNNVSKKISMTLKQVSFARWSYLSNSESQLFWWWKRPVWFVTGDILQGPLHTNDQLNIYGDPIFDGPVSSTNPALNYYHGGPPEDNPDFRQSLTLGAPAIQLPASGDIITPISDAAQASGGSYFTGNTSVTLLNDGTMDVINYASYNDYNTHNVPLPQNQALFVNNGYLNISGTLNGQLTAGTSGNIYIMDNLFYNNDPRVDPASTDMLGLVAQNNVYADQTAPYDLEIDGYIVALNTSFGVANYASPPAKGTLTIYGGITQDRRGAIGTFNGTTGEKLSGYTKNYNYDERLANYAPSYFPAAKDNAGRIFYLKVLWTEY